MQPQAAIATDAANDFVVSSQQRQTFMVAHMHQPDALDRVQPREFIQMKAALGQRLLHGADGGFDGGAFARVKLSVCMA